MILILSTRISSIVCCSFQLHYFLCYLFICIFQIYRGVNWPWSALCLCNWTREICSTRWYWILCCAAKMGNIVDQPGHRCQAISFQPSKCHRMPMQCDIRGGLSPEENVSARTRHCIGAVTHCMFGFCSIQAPPPNRTTRTWWPRISLCNSLVWPWQLASQLCSASVIKNCLDWMWNRWKPSTRQWWWLRRSIPRKHASAECRPMLVLPSKRPKDQLSI